MRKLAGYPALVVGVVGVVMSLYHVYARLTPAAPDSLVLRVITLAFSLVLAFLLFPARTVAPRTGSPGATWAWRPSRSPVWGTCSSTTTTSPAASPPRTR